GRIDDLEGLVRGHGHVQALALPGHGADTKHVDGCHGNVGPGWRPKKATKLMSNALMKHPSRNRTGKKKSNGAERLDVTYGHRYDGLAVIRPLGLYEMLDDGLLRWGAIVSYRVKHLRARSRPDL